MTPLFVCTGPLPRRERGVVLLISLIVLAVLLAAGVALVRSFDTSLFQAGNLSFKRDLANQAERVTPIIRANFTGTGALTTTVARGADQYNLNYSATLLPSNAQGIPTALLANDPGAVEAGGVVSGVPADMRVRYVIDRMCQDTGDETTLGDRCIGVDYSERGGSVSGAGINPLRQVTYRVSIRVDGPRNTQAFFQSTFSL